MKRLFSNKLLIVFMVSIVLLVFALLIIPRFTTEVFDGEQAMFYLQKQISFGPRTPGSQSHADFVDWALECFGGMGWDVELQEGKSGAHSIVNIVASHKRADADAPWILLGAHYDSRIYADQDADMGKRSEPVPGANDGASGVAVLLELASTIPADFNKNLTIVLFDAEDQGDIPGWQDWCLGSELMASQFDGDAAKPDAMVLVDMIGDKDLNIYREQYSSKELIDEIWQVAAKEGFEDVFINQYKYAMMDDHIPFLKRGIPAVDLIDFDYPQWHTVDDLPDQISEASLTTVGTVLYTWLMSE